MIKQIENVQATLSARHLKELRFQLLQMMKLLITTDQLFSRYWGNKKATRPHLSGDLGFVNEFQEVVLTGRKKNMIIRKNFNIYPGLYEPTINNIPGVEVAALIGTYDEKADDENVTLFIEANKIIKRK